MPFRHRHFRRKLWRENAVTVYLVEKLGNSGSTLISSKLNAFRKLFVRRGPCPQGNKYEVSMARRNLVPKLEVKVALGSG